MLALAWSSARGDFLVLCRLEEDTELAVGFPISDDTVPSLALEPSFSLLFRVSSSVRGGFFLYRPDEETALAAGLLTSAGMFSLGLDFCLLTRSSSTSGGFLLCRLDEELETELAVGLPDWLFFGREEADLERGGYCRRARDEGEEARVGFDDVDTTDLLVREEPPKRRARLSMVLMASILDELERDLSAS